MRRILGDRPWQKQCEILEAVRDNPRVAVRSCHGAGKSWIAARVALWFLYSFPYSIVLTTAPTFRQVKKVLWQEIRKAYFAATMPLGGTPLQTELAIKDGWYAFGFTADNPEAAQGIHAESGSILAILDEASGVPPEIWIAVESCLASIHARELSIGNPTDPTGEFANRFTDKTVCKIKVSAFDTPNLRAGKVVQTGLVTKQWVEDKRRRWGETSPLYISRVLGDFPEAASDTLIPLSWIEAAQERTLKPKGPTVLGVDVARYGGDETVVCECKGPVARVTHAAFKQDTMATTGAVVQAARDAKPRAIGVDVVGIGAGVYDRLKEQTEFRKLVWEAQAGGKSRDPDQFLNLRAQWFWDMREKFELGEIDIDPNDGELAAQVSALRYKVDSKGRILIESKDDMKKRGLPSPDRADALAIALGTPSRRMAKMRLDLRVDVGYQPDKYKV